MRDRIYVVQWDIEYMFFNERYTLCCAMRDRLYVVQWEIDFMLCNER